jgi:hypothetical protein
VETIIYIRLQKYRVQTFIIIIIDVVVGVGVGGVVVFYFSAQLVA